MSVAFSETKSFSDQNLFLIQGVFLLCKNCFVFGINAINSKLKTMVTLDLINVLGSLVLSFIRPVKLFSSIALLTRSNYKFIINYSFCMFSSSLFCFVFLIVFSCFLVLCKLRCRITIAKKRIVHCT